MKCHLTFCLSICTLSEGVILSTRIYFKMGKGKKVTKEIFDGKWCKREMFPFNAQNMQVLLSRRKRHWMFLKRTKETTLTPVETSPLILTAQSSRKLWRRSRMMMVLLTTLVLSIVKCILGKLYISHPKVCTPPPPITWP